MQNTGGICVKIIDSFKNMRSAALQTTLSALNELHRRGSFNLPACLLPGFYALCLGPLESPGAEAAAASKYAKKRAWSLGED